MFLFLNSQVLELKCKAGVGGTALDMMQLIDMPNVCKCGPKLGIK